MSYRIEVLTFSKMLTFSLRFYPCFIPRQVAVLVSFNKPPKKLDFSVPRKALMWMFVQKFLFNYKFLLWIDVWISLLCLCLKDKSRV